MMNTSYSKKLRKSEKYFLYVGISNLYLLFSCNSSKKKMFSAELHNFKVPTNLISLYQADNLEDPKIKNLIYNHHFNAKVLIHSPCGQSMEDQIKLMFVEDSMYYIIKNLNIVELCKHSFIQQFVEKGSFMACSYGKNIDLDNSAAFSPTGMLSILVDKLSYYKIGIEGSLSKFILRIPKEKFVIQINTKREDFLEGKNCYENIQKKLTNYQLFFDFRVSWTAKDRGVCPSSIAKYFVDLGYDVFEEDCVYYDNSVVNINIPKLDDIKLSDAENILNWLGLHALNISKNGFDLCSNEDSYIPHSDLYITHLTGFYSADIIGNFVRNVRKCLNENNLPWISMTIYGDEDCCIAWNTEENCYRLNGDNHYTLIIHRNKVTCIRLEACMKPDRFYDKSSNK